MPKKIKIIRTSTIPTSLDTFCRDTLRHLSEKYEVVVVSSPGEALDKIARREGVRTIAVPMSRRISLIKDLVSLVRLVSVFRRERPDMVHSITPKAGLLCMMAAWLCRVPVRLHTFTGLVFPTSHGFRRLLLMFTDWLTCACATHVVPEGQGVKNDLERYGITRKPMEVLGYGNVRGVDMDYYSRTPEVMRKAEELRRKDLFTFIFVGRIVRDKGIEELVEAFEQLQYDCPRTRLVLVGRFEQDIDPVSEETLRKIEDNHCIECVGMQKDVRPWYAASDMLVLPSYREGFPNVVLEAGAMGVPAIVTNINGSREIIKDGENGLVVYAHSVTSLYDSMLWSADSPYIVAMMARTVRDVINERYNKQFVEKCLFDYYDKILKNCENS